MIKQALAFVAMLKLWKNILHGDISYYCCHPDGTDFLTVKEAWQIAWIVWMT